LSARDAAAQAGTQTAKLRTEDLHKSFGQRPVLDGVSLSIGAGESLVIVGPSGTGKSVLLKHFIASASDSGKVFADGVELRTLDHVTQRATQEVRHGVSGGRPFDSMFYDNIAFRCGAPAKPAEVRARVEGGLSLQLPDVAIRGHPSSRGMRRRVGFARAIAHKPEIHLFDEPNTGLTILTDIIAEVILGIRKRCARRSHDHPPHAQRAQDRGPAGASSAGISCSRARLRSSWPHGPAVRQFVEEGGGPLTVEAEGDGRRSGGR
jgi:phospholipid/cholesterol/gamma-HCH transport system ATP-binding protein